MSKYVLGIDPGTYKSGYIFLYLDCDNYVGIIDKGYIDNHDMRLIIYRNNIKYSDMEVAIETIVSYGMPMGQTTIDTSIFAGRYYQIAEDMDINAHFVTRPDIKLNLTHSKRSKQNNVKQALKNRFGDLGTKKNPGRLYNLKVNLIKGGLDHVWSAFAVAITYIDLTYGLAL